MYGWLLRHNILLFDVMKFELHLPRRVLLGFGAVLGAAGVVGWASGYCAPLSCITLRSPYRTARESFRFII